ncbi:MAG: hypothetical protein PHV02_13770 [Rhodocyclaceae bacterium]|nr:hypothetical protein [Rhodocyclaceae bacterium]
MLDWPVQALSDCAAWLRDWRNECHSMAQIPNERPRNNLAA